jgi:hypothetical protein
MRRNPANHRMNRRDFFESRTQILRPLTKEDYQKRLERETKKYLQEQGLIGPKVPATWQVDIGENVPIVLTAFTRSEARAKLKQELGVTKLPAGLKIKKVVYEPII